MLTLILNGDFYLVTSLGLRFYKKLAHYRQVSSRPDNPIVYEKKGSVAKYANRVEKLREEYNIKKCDSNGNCVVKFHNDGELEWKILAVREMESEVYKHKLEYLQFVKKTVSVES